MLSRVSAHCVCVCYGVSSRMGCYPLNREPVCVFSGADRPAELAQGDDALLPAGLGKVECQSTATPAIQWTPHNRLHHLAVLRS